MLLKYLRVLKDFLCLIKAIQSFAFKGLVNLGYLLLKNSRIKNITSDGFNGINNLKYLLLSHNDLEMCLTHLDVKEFNLP